MQAFGNIVIFHPAAIGDAMLATPVAKTLRLNFPGAKITYWSHPSLRELILGLCPSVDEFVDFAKEGGFKASYNIFRALKPDLFVDLSNSSRAKFFTLFSNARVLRYVKRPVEERPIMHAVDNFMLTIAPVCEEVPEPLFPTIFPEALASEVLPSILGFEAVLTSSKPIVGVVPGVGKHRAHRAWIRDGWIYLLQTLGQNAAHTIVMVGGEDEVDLCADLASESGISCLNLAGRLSLAQTAAVLKNCDLVIAGDTGPAHIANAVGTVVIGLHGPTFPERSGPYDYLGLVLDQSKSCQCLDLKSCRLALPTQAGECMGRIMLPEIMEKVEAVLQNRGQKTG